MATASDPADFLGGERFKGYEAEAQTQIRGPLAAIRVDGKGFSKFTRERGYEAPYDLLFMDIMDRVAKALLLLIDGSHFAYVQSDEISVVFGPTGSETDPQWWFGGKVQKLVSISAAQASLSFALGEFGRSGELVNSVFDSRVLNLKHTQDAEEYLRWRRFDAQKNSVSMAASSRFSHRELQGVGTRERAAMLQGTELERLPEGFFNGRLIHRTQVPLERWDSWTESHTTTLRTAVRVEPATRDYVEAALPSLLADRTYSETQL